MGGSSKAKVDIPRFYMSIHYGICQGPVDSLRAIYVGEKVAWNGSVSQNTALSIDQEGLFGGIQKEGGVSGAVDVMLGDTAQLASTGLAARLGLGSPIETPAYRGITSLLFRDGASGGFYWCAANPYMKPVWAKVARYPRQLDGATAQVPRRSLGRVSICLVLDKSDSMTGQRLETLYRAYLETLDLLAGMIDNGTDLDFAVCNFSGQIISEKHSANTGARKFSVRWRDNWDALASGGGANFATAIQPAVNWFDESAGDRFLEARVLVFVTGGLPNPLSSADQARTAAANLLNRTIPVDMYGVNIEETNTAHTSKLDNTSFDGVPVVPPDDPAVLSNVIARALAKDYDANPAHIIYECCTNTDWGLGHDPASIDLDAFLQVARTLRSEGMGLSLQWTQPASVEEFVNGILDCINGSVFTHPRTGKLTLRLTRDDYDVATLRTITPGNANLSNFSRRAWGETINEMKVTWTNPDSENEETVYSQDLGSIAMQGAVVSDSRNYAGVRTAGLAQKLANRELRAASAPLSSCEATVDRTLWDITPLECVKLVWPEYGVESVVMRVVKVSYGSTGNSQVKLSLVEDVFGLPAATFVAPPPSVFVPPADQPVAASTARILELPAYAVSQGGTRPDSLEYPETLAAILVAPPAGLGTATYDLALRTATPSGGYEWVAAGSTRAFVGRGALAEAVSAAAQSTFAALADLVGTDAAKDTFLVIGSDNAASDALELALVTAVDTTDGSLSVTRGVLDTTPRNWPAGTPVWVLTADDFEALPGSYTDGQVVQVRVLTNTPLGQTAIQDAPTFEAQVVSRATLPSRPAAVTVDGVDFGEGLAPAGPVQVTWANRNRLQEDTAVLAWDAASVPPETGATTTVRVTDQNGAVLSEATAIPAPDGSYTLDLTPFAPAKVNVSVWAERETLESWQGHSVAIRTDGIDVPLLNPGAEDAIGAEWAALAGVWAGRQTGAVHTGAGAFSGGQEVWFAQVIDIPATYHADIDAGEFRAAGQAFARGSAGAVSLAALDTAGGWLAEGFSAISAPTDWRRLSTEFWLPPGTRKLRVGARSTSARFYSDDFRALLSQAGGASALLYSSQDVAGEWIDADTRAPATQMGAGPFGDAFRCVGSAEGAFAEHFTALAIPEEWNEALDLGTGGLQVIAQQGSIGGPAYGQMQVRFLDGSGAAIGQPVSTEVIQADDYGTPVKLEAVLPAGVRSLELALRGMPLAAGAQAGWTRLAAMLKAA